MSDGEQWKKQTQFNEEMLEFMESMNTRFDELRTQVDLIFMMCKQSQQQRQTQLQEDSRVDPASGQKSASKFPDPEIIRHARYDTIKIPKLDFPTFDGVAPREWIRKCEQYFTIHSVSNDLKLRLGELHLRGEAELWLIRWKLSNPSMSMSWESLKDEVCNRFEVEGLLVDEFGQQSPLKLEGPVAAHNLFDKMSSPSLKTQNEGDDNSEDGMLPVVSLSEVMESEVDIKEDESTNNSSKTKLGNVCIVSDEELEHALSSKLNHLDVNEELMGPFENGEQHFGGESDEYGSADGFWKARKKEAINLEVILDQNVIDDVAHKLFHKMSRLFRAVLINRPVTTSHGRRFQSFSTISVDTTEVDRIDSSNLTRLLGECENVVLFNEDALFLFDPGGWRIWSLDDRCCFNWGELIDDTSWKIEVGLADIGAPLVTALPEVLLGGYSWSQRRCDPFKYKGERGDYCFATNMADISVKAIIHITRIMVASVFEAIVQYHGSDGEFFEHMAGTLLEWSLLYWFSRRNCLPSKNVCVCVVDWRFYVACGLVFQLLFEVVLVFCPFQFSVLSSKSWRHGLYLFINVVLDGKGWEICLQKSDHCVSLKHLKRIHWVLDFDVVRLFWMMLCNGTRVEEMGGLFASLCYDALKVIMDSSDLMQSFVPLSSSLELNHLRDGYLRTEMTPDDLSCVHLEFFIPFSINNDCLISSSYNSKEKPLEVLKLLMKQHDLSIPCILEYKCAVTIILGIYPLLDGHDTAHSLGRENVVQAIVRFTTITQNASPRGLDGIEDVLKTGCNTLGLKVSYLIWVVKTLFMFWLINQKCQCDHTFKDLYSVCTYCSVECPNDHVKDISLLYIDEAWFLVRIENYEMPRSLTDCPKATSFWFDSIMVKVPYKQTIKAFYLFPGKHHLVLRKEIVLVVAVNMENFVWNPGQSVISFCIIEGNDVFEGEEVIEDIHNVMKLCELLHTLTLASNNENKAQVQIALVKEIYAIYVEPDMNYLHRIMYRKDVETGLITITLKMNGMCKGGNARHTHHLNSWIVHRLQLEIFICWRDSWIVHRLQPEILICWGLFEENQRQSHLNLVLNIAGEPHKLKLISTMKVHDYLAVSFCKGMHSIVAKSIFKKLVAWDIYIMEQRLRFYPLGVLCQCNEIVKTSYAGELKAIRSRDFYAKWKPIDSWRHFLDDIVLAAIFENFVWDPGLYMLQSFSILEDKDVLKGREFVRNPSL